VVICAKSENKLRERRLRARQRGFTIAELLTVVGVIGLMAALSAPVFVQMMRDRRVQQAGLEMRDLVRMARSRALGRGAATVVRWNASVTGATSRYDGQLQIREAISGGTDVCSPWPASSCSGTDWAAGSTSTTQSVSKPIAAFDKEVGPYELLEVTMVDASGSTIPYAEICFTPRGNTYMRTSATGTFSRLAEIPRFQLKNIKTNLQSVVVLAPNGDAKLRTRIN
jgi:type IV fimbrial biogenesis protein FimT